MAASTSTTGEAGDVDHQNINEEILEIQEKYYPEYIYNWDETGLYILLILIQLVMKLEDAHVQLKHRII